MPKNEIEDSRKEEAKVSNEANSFVKLFCQKLFKRRMFNLTNRNGKILPVLIKLDEATEKGPSILVEISEKENSSQICNQNETNPDSPLNLCVFDNKSNLSTSKDREKLRIFCFDLPYENDCEKNEFDYLLGKRKRFGLNIKGVCLNRKCFAFEKEVIASMGMPCYLDISTDHEQITCPLCCASMNRELFIEFEFSDCYYKLTGRKKGSRAVYGTQRFRMTQRGHAHLIYAKNWDWLEIETLPVCEPRRRINII
jgi:hypothetical protein